MGNLDSLPAEIILDILKRLEIDSVIQYRLESRSWNYPVYHCLLDYLKETQVELERKVKQLKSGPLNHSNIQRKVSAYMIKNVEETMESVKQGIINTQKISGGRNAVLFGRNLLYTSASSCKMLH
ncbi:hypothetical protein MKW98_001633 [Papaver atlanticum]|uniref:F-box domain-containing protein n=1 Tax=Papaver atlanticum TaxID=357466 RepID=A0AAD4S7Y7_9MAGN|nr:hypothetical protein MKW98_001633 [Papaver atlanticum]